jgi:hypothetical protein
MMAESGAARALVIVGAVLQIFSGGFRVLLGIIFMLDAAIRRSINPNDPLLPLTEGITTYLLLGALIGLILLILWFVFATKPSKFKKAILATGVIGILLSGILPGLLVLIGGFKAKEQEETKG